MNCERCSQPLPQTFVRYQGSTCWPCQETLDKEVDRLLCQQAQRRIEPVEGPEHEDRIL